MPESGQSSPNWFEHNPKKTIFFVLVFLFILMDFILAELFPYKIPNIRNQYYHHDLDTKYHGVLGWGENKYIINTNSLGFKDKNNRVVALKNAKRRIVFIGDSFTEGIGVPYEQTFVGLIEQALDKSTYEVLNAGVASYSPKLYYHKIKYLIEIAGFKFNDLYVFVDISDVQDEIEYEKFQPSNSHLLSLLYRLRFWLKTQSFIGSVAYRFKSRLFFFLKHNSKQSLWKNEKELNERRDAWIYNENDFKQWGEKGFGLAANYMSKLDQLCKKHNIKLTIAVYPWPNEIKKNNYKHSKNVVLWQDFCEKRKIPFINCYYYFFTKDEPENIIKKYYIRNDVHFNFNGHKLMATAWLDHFDAQGKP